MALTKTELQSYLHDQFKEFEAKAGMTNDLSASGYKRIIENTIVKLGLGYANSINPAYDVPDGGEIAAQAVGEVFTLERLERVFGAKKDFAVSGSGVSPEKSIILEQIRMLLLDAYARAGMLGYEFATSAQKGMTLRTMRTNWIEGPVVSDA